MKLLSEVMNIILILRRSCFSGSEKCWSTVFGIDPNGSMNATQNDQTGWLKTVATRNDVKRYRSSINNEKRPYPTMAYWLIVNVNTVVIAHLIVSLDDPGKNG